AQRRPHLCREGVRPDVRRRDDKPTDLRRIMHRRLQRDTTTERVTHDVPAGQLEMFDQRSDVAGHEPDVDRSIDVSGAAMSLEVDGDDLVALREKWKNWSEHLARPKSSVEQDQRAPGSVGFVIEVDTVDLGVLAGALHRGGPIGL